MKIHTTTDGYTAVQMSDEEAEVLASRLQMFLQHRKEIGAVEPSMLLWADCAASFPGLNTVITFSIVKESKDASQPT